MEFLGCFHEQVPHTFCSFSMLHNYNFPAETDLKVRPCAHSDFSAEASNRDNSEADRLLLIGSPGQE